MKVSVIIPFNKDRGFLKDAIRSVDNQSHEDIEMIIEKGNGTLGMNVNNGLQRASGEFIKILAEDDLLTNNSIADLSNGIGEYDFITANAFNFKHIAFDSPTDFKEIHVGGIKTLEQMISRNCIHGGTVLYRKSSFEKFGYMDEGLVTGEEYDLHLKWMSKGARQAYVNSEVYLYRLWKGSKSQGKIEHSSRKQYLEMIKDRYR